MIHRLDGEGLGRGIANISDPEHKFLGYSLALTPDDSQHLVVFNDGRMIAIRSQSSEGGGVYKRTFESDPDPVLYGAANSSQVIDKIQYSGAKILATNDREDVSELFNTFFDQALTVATARKAEREQVKRATMSSFVDKFGAFFKQGETDAPLDSPEASGEPPHEPPQAPPQEN